MSTEKPAGTKAEQPATVSESDSIDRAAEAIQQSRQLHLSPETRLSWRSEIPEYKDTLRAEVREVIAALGDAPSDLSIGSDKDEELLTILKNIILQRPVPNTKEINTIKSALGAAIQSVEFQRRWSVHLPHKTVPVFLLPPSTARLADPVWQVCSYTQMREPAFVDCMSKLNMAPVTFRKNWDYAYILRTLEQTGKISTKKGFSLSKFIGEKVIGRGPAIGLGIGAGTGRLPSYFASCGCQVLATDKVLTTKDAAWHTTGQHASGKEQLYYEDIVSHPQFDKLVDFAHMDADQLSTLDDNRFDFVWSTSVIEHIGEVDEVSDLLHQCFRVLKTGGVFVHTTELNLTFDDFTNKIKGCYIFTKSDIQKLYDECKRIGFECPGLNFSLGNDPEDFKISDNVIIVRKRWTNIDHTSFGMWGRKP